MNTPATTGMPRVYAPVVTPFKSDLSVDVPRFVQFCQWLVTQRAGLAIFGTNSEANSLSTSERLELLERVVEAGIAPRDLMPGTGACALPDAIALTRETMELGCENTLVLPPFYYKGMPDEGLFRYYSEIIQAVGCDALKIYLYHIPQVSGVPLTLSLIERLRHAYPHTVVGIKDSSGDWDYLHRLLAELPGFQIFPASETLLEKALPLGASGCISATANLQSKIIADYIGAAEGPRREDLKRQLSAVRMRMQKTAMIPALKAVVAHFSEDSAWNRVRPPFVEVAPDEALQLIRDLESLNFTMPGVSRLGS